MSFTYHLLAEGFTNMLKGTPDRSHEELTPWGLPQALEYSQEI